MEHQAVAEHQVPHQLFLHGIQKLIMLPGRILGSTVCIRELSISG